MSLRGRGPWPGCLLAVVALLGACTRSPGPSGTDARPSQNGKNHAELILLRGNGVEPDSLDPQKARSAEAQTILRDLCEGLTTVAKDASPAPGVASDWSVSADGRSYTFHLRANARWSSGEKVVGADFVAGLRRLVDPATASQYAQVVDVITNARAIIAGKQPPESLGVAAPDDATVVITLVSPAPYLPGLLAHPSACPVHRATLAAHPGEVAKPGVMVSDGAFVLKEWLPNAYVFAARNRHYWNDAATHLDGVRYVSTADENAELRLYRAGALQVTNTVPRGQFDWIKANLAADLHVAPQLSTYYYGFNLDRPLFRDHPGLRRALSLVIDRERLAGSVLRVGELPAFGWVPPGTDHYTSQSFDYAARPIAARIAEAQGLYAAAGYSREKPLRFELRYNAGEVHGKVAVAVAAMWKEALGVEATLVAVEFKSLMQDIDERKVDLFRLAWIGDYNDAYTFAQYLKSDFGINLPHYRNRAYDEMLARAAAEVDADKRRALLEAAERKMLADHPLLPLYFYVNKHLVSPHLHGWYDNIMNVVYSRDLELVP
jgi:oligopeptide transport system substrate-binding protein